MFVEGQGQPLCASIESKTERLPSLDGSLERPPNLFSAFEILSKLLWNRNGAVAGTAGWMQERLEL